MKILFNFSEKYKIDYSSFYHDLYGGKDTVNELLKTTNCEKFKTEDTIEILEILRETVPSEIDLEKTNLIKQNKENMLISEVEEIWEQINLFDNWEPLYQKIKKLRSLGTTLNAQKLVNF